MPERNRTLEGYAHNPYRTFRFQVLIDGEPVAGLRKMTALRKTTEAVSWRAAGDTTHERKLPGATSYEPVTLEQGLTMDPVFENWANLVNQLNEPIELPRFRKDIVITLMNLEGRPAIGYHLYDAWVSEYEALPDLDAGTTNTVGIQTIRLEHEGWERDPEVADDPPRLPRSRH